MQISPRHQVPITCPECGTEGWYDSADPGRPALIVCGNCGARTSDVFCAKCKCRGPFVELIEPPPTEFKCRSCGAQQELPRGFWKQPRKLQQDAPMDAAIRKEMTATHMVLIVAAVLFALLLVYQILTG